MMVFSKYNPPPQGIWKPWVEAKTKHVNLCNIVIFIRNDQHMYLPQAFKQAAKTFWSFQASCGSICTCKCFLRSLHPHSVLMKASWPLVIKIMPLSAILIGSIIRNVLDSLFNCEGTFGIQFLKSIFNENYYILT